MPDDIALMPVRKSEIEVGIPLPFALYDGHQKLLMQQGEAVNSEQQLQAMLNKGVFKRKPTTSPAVDAPFSALAADGPKTLPPAFEAHAAAPHKPKEETIDLEALKLMPGDALQLQSQLEGQTERWTVYVIGQMKQKSLLVSAPMVDGKLIFVKDGQTFLVRAFSGLNVCAFKARVLKSQLQPFPYLHLAWPDSVQAMRIRKTMRAPASIVVAIYEAENGAQTGAGRIVDISVGGAKVISQIPLGHKDQVIWMAFKVKLGDLEEYIKTPVIVRSSGEELDPQGKSIRYYGVQFGELVQSQRLIIMNLVYQYLLKEPG